MTSMLFWNTNGKAINPWLIDAIAEHNCDIVVLAEYAESIRGLCNELSLDPYHKDFNSAYIADVRIKIASSYEYKHEVRREDDHYVIHSIKADSKEFLLVAVHLPSKLYDWDGKRREHIAREILMDIQNADQKNVVIVGDFNANPFERVCIGEDYFFAVPSRAIAKKEHKVFCGEKRRMHYNPMWNLFDDNEPPDGTYYYGKGIFWNIFDQVLISPAMIECFDNSSLKILSTVRGSSLVKQNGVPIETISDHLPIIFKFREETMQ